MRNQSETTGSRGIDDVIRDIDRRLRRAHIRRADRRRILGDIQGDLVAAKASGTAPADVLGADLDVFVAETLEAEGLNLRRYDLARTTVGGALSGIAALIIGYLLITLVLHPIFTGLFTLKDRYPNAGAALTLVGLTLAGLVGVLLFLRIGMRGRPSIKGTMLRASALVPLGAAAGTAVVIAVGTLDESMPIWQSILAGLAIAVPTIGGIAVSRWWAVSADLSGSSTAIDVS